MQYRPIHAATVGLTLAAIVLSPAVGAAAVFQLDFNGTGSITQSGYVGMGPAAEENSAFTHEAVFTDAFGAGENVTVYFSGNRAKQRAVLTGSYEGQSALLRDWYGKDSIASFSLSLTLPYGTYKLTSFHHDVIATSTTTIIIDLVDAAKTNSTTVSQTYGSAPEAIGTFTGNVTSNGAAAVTLTYNATGQIGINGLHLEPFGFWSNPSGGLWSSEDNWLHGHVAAGADTIASFRGVDIEADVTVNLDSSQTLYGLIFDDANAASPAGWRIDNNGNPANTITLSSSASTIRVNTLGAGKVAEIAATLEGDGIVKDGVGTLVLSGSNTYTGTTTVSAGVLSAQHNSALGSTGGGTVVSNGAALELQGGVSIAGESLTITGTGVGSGGVLRSVSGTNAWTGAIALSGNSSIGVAADTLTLSG
ncbi:MAG: autotransporter-associated beta strand repeat-containing protein, partial [Patescibacteria group bacterium]|nr:autotransporter-associated beta strand repeat-containing protein [Patescibacteria group bacterium]